MGWLLLVLIFEGGEPVLYHMDTDTQEECADYSAFLNEQENVTAFCQPKNPQVQEWKYEHANECNTKSNNVES